MLQSGGSGHLYLAKEFWNTFGNILLLWTRQPFRRTCCRWTSHPCFTGFVAPFAEETSTLTSTVFSNATTTTMIDLPENVSENVSSYASLLHRRLTGDRTGRGRDHRGERPLRPFSGRRGVWEGPLFGLPSKHEEVESSC